MNGRHQIDYLVVGAGFAGSVASRELAEAGLEVHVIDRRSHLGGNAYDEVDANGVLVHRYGPHIFHTNSERIFRYLSHFTEWHPYEHRVRCSVGGKLYPFPINRDTLNQLYGLELDEAGAAAFFGQVREPHDPVLTSEDVVLNSVGRDLYEKFFLEYTRKQWGLEPSQLKAGVAARIPVRTSTDDPLFHRHFPGHALGRLYTDVRADAGSSEHHSGTGGRL
jgi:UDP-galactopyranose mutase